MKIKALRKFGLLAVVAMFFLTALNAGEVSGAKKKYHTWEEVAADMSLEFDQARSFAQKDEYRAAYERINSAYFGYYEVQGFEKNVMVAISSARVGHIEALFGKIKHALLGNEEISKEGILDMIESLRVKVYKDAMVLDGVADASDSDSVGEVVYGDKAKPAKAEVLGDDPKEILTTPTKVSQEPVMPPKAKKSAAEVAAARAWMSFITAFGLLVREGLEAILVIVAIVAYLIKTGNKKMVYSVYWGSLAAIGASAILAVAVERYLGGSGVARELIEGWTMFLAVVVLFYVSNWMLSKSEVAAWEQFIGEKVQHSIDRRSQMTLVFAAFIAVMREGAELILFYKAAFSGGMSSTPYVIYGIVAGTAVLIGVYVAFRYFSVKLPLKPFFFFTSVLLFVMCVSFMGKGVMELTEANVITGRTVIPAMKGFSIAILNIYDRAETLIPQVMLVIASLWILLSHTLGGKKQPQHKEQA